MYTDELTQFWERYKAELLPLYKNTAAIYHALMYDFANDNVNDTSSRRFILNLKLASVIRDDQNLIVMDIFLEDQEQDFIAGAIVGKNGLIDTKSLVQYDSNYEFEEYSCDGCKETPVGIVCYHCEECDYDLCEECVNLKDQHEHAMFENNAHFVLTEFNKKDITARILIELR